MLFDSVGIDFAREGKKCTNFDTVVSTLGVELNLCDPEGRVLLGHTERRKSELSNAVGEIIEKGKIDTKFAESLRGRMQRFEGYVFGRTAQRCVRTVGELSLRSAKSSNLTPLELKCFRDLHLDCFHRWRLCRCKRQSWEHWRSLDKSLWLSGEIFL